MKIMYTDEELPQGSEEWLKLRKDYGTASEAASACEVSPWSPKNRYELYQLKTGDLKVKMNFAMQHGNHYEQEAREAFQNEFNKLYEPCCIANEIEGLPLMASLDGREVLSGNSILEIKCPLKGNESPLWNTMLLDEDLPIQYQLQMTQQMLLAEVKVCHFWVYCAHSKQGLYREFKLGKHLTKQVLEGWKEYFKGIPEPAITDVVVEDSDEWNTAAYEYIEAKERADKANYLLTGAKEKLVELAGGQSRRGNGALVKINDKGKASVRKC